MIDDVKSAKFFLDNVYFWKLGTVDDNGVDDVDDEDEDDDSNSYLDPGLQKRDLQTAVSWRTIICNKSFLLLIIITLAMAIPILH